MIRKDRKYIDTDVYTMNEKQYEKALRMNEY